MSLKSIPETFKVSAVTPYIYLNKNTTMQEKINQAIQLFQSMDGVEKAGFTLWSICVLAFYGILLYILFLAGKSISQRIRFK